MTGASVTVIADMGHIPRLGDWLWIAEQIVQMADPDRA